MTFIDSVKIIWALQFTISGLLVLKEMKADPEGLEEIDYPKPLIGIAFFLLCFFAGWRVIWIWLDDYLPFWFRHPIVWFYFKYGYDIKKATRTFKRNFKAQRLRNKCRKAGILAAKSE